MCTILEIERAVSQFSPNVLAEFRTWFAQFDADAWVCKMEADAGRLDAFAAEALSELRSGRCTEL